MWKSGNCVVAREGTSKSSFLGSVFHDYSSFFDTCCRNLRLPPFIEGIIYIILNLWNPLGIPFETHICNILHFIFLMTFSPNNRFQNEISLRHLRHIGGKGGTGRHLGGICEASGRHLGGIWEASGRHLGGIWDSRATWSSRRLRITKIDAPLS
jgi:hypothetical protein